MMLGNKSDCERKVSSEVLNTLIMLESEQYCRWEKLPYGIS